MIALAEPSPCASGGGDLFGRYRDNFDGLALKECIEFSAARRAQPTFQHDGGFKDIERRHADTVQAEQRFFKIGAGSFSGQDGADCR